MKTNALRRSDQGFTLIEIMIALVILAVGLLGLQSLGISAVRSTAQAEKNSRAAVAGTQYLEEAMLSVRRGGTPTQLCVTTPDGDQVSRIVDVTSPKRPAVTVVVTPRGPNARPYSVSSYAYSPNALPAPTGNACP